MPRLIWVFAGHTGHFVGFSCSGLFFFFGVSGLFLIFLFFPVVFLNRNSIIQCRVWTQIKHYILHFLLWVCSVCFVPYNGMLDIDAGVNGQMSLRMTKPTKWPLRPAKTQISLDIRPVWSVFTLSVVECRTPEREVRGSRPTAAVLCPWARHFTPRKYWLITQEAMAPSRHDWKIVDWDVKPQHNQPKVFTLPSKDSQWSKASSWIQRRLIRLGGCPGLSESLLGTQVILLNRPR